MTYDFFSLNLIIYQLVYALLVFYWFNAMRLIQFLLEF